MGQRRFTSDALRTPSRPGDELSAAPAQCSVETRRGRVAGRQRGDGRIPLSLARRASRSGRGRRNALSAVEFAHLKRGATVEVTLRSSAANVRLMDSQNFNAYKAGRQHRYVGGLVKQSPSRIAVPRDGRWYVTVDMNGLRGSTQSSVRVIPPPLPTAGRGLSGGSLADIQHEEPPPVADDAQVWDVFVSHASEDKVAVARP